MDVFWIFVLAGTLGVVLIVPTVLRAVDGLPSDPVVGSFGFGATVFAAVGFLLQQFGLNTLTSVIAALALGGATAAIHTEILSLLGGRPSNRTVETCPAPFDDEIA